MKIVLISIISMLVSCVNMDMTTARAVQSKPGKGGIVTLNPPNDPRARAKADDIMKMTCSSKKPEIIEEGEAVVGTSTNSSTQSNSSGASGVRVAGLNFGSSSPSTSTDSVQKQVTEWRITYECK